MLRAQTAPLSEVMRTKATDGSDEGALFQKIGVRSFAYRRYGCAKFDALQKKSVFILKSPRGRATNRLRFFHRNIYSGVLFLNSSDDFSEVTPSIVIYSQTRTEYRIWVRI